VRDATVSAEETGGFKYIPGGRECFQLDLVLDRMGGMVAGLELLIAIGGETYDMDRDLEHRTGSRCIWE
jgi:hypothetical protein